jgi:hypothetical protein
MRASKRAKSDAMYARCFDVADVACSLEGKKRIVAPLRVLSFTPLSDTVRPCTLTTACMRRDDEHHANIQHVHQPSSGSALPPFAVLICSCH